MYMYILNVYVLCIMYNMYIPLCKNHIMVGIKKSISHWNIPEEWHRSGY